MNIKLEKTWKKVLHNYFEKDEWKKLKEFIKKEYLTKIIYPHPKKIFNAFEKTPFEKVKVVILGQDPYHTPKKAHGLAFSVEKGNSLPPSLKNIYKEIEKDLNIKKDFSNGNLENWANQGVFLLNSILTVEKGIAKSHAKKGWEDFTDYVIKKLSSEKYNLVFLLWGNDARQKGKIIDRNKHLVLESTHPSPFSVHYGFFGSKHFSKTNEYLSKHNKEIIIW